MCLSILLLVLGLGWLGTVWYIRRYVKRIFQKYQHWPHDLRASIDPKYYPIIRNDIGKWNEKTILRNCWLVFPLHFFSLGGYLLTLGILTVIKRYLWLPDWMVNSYRYYFGRLAFKICFKLKENFNSREKITTPLVVANHMGWSDIIYMGGCMAKTSFVSMSAVRDYPVISSIANYLQTIYVDRDNKENKGSVKEQIVERNQQFKKDPEANYPISIYPEATVGAGRAVLEFKNGAFQSMSSITILSLRYSCKEFHSAHDNLSILQHFFLTMCLRPEVQIKKHVIVPNPDDTVETYRERCRSKLAEMLNFPLVELNYKDVMKHYKLIEAEFKERIAKAKSSQPS